MDNIPRLNKVVKAFLPVDKTWSIRYIEKMQWTVENTKKYMKEYRKANRDKLLAQRKAWRKAHPNADREYFQRNKTKIMQKNQARTKVRYATDPIFRAKIKTKSIQQYYNLREAVHVAFGGQCKWCGYSGPAWHLDHVNGDGDLERKRLSQAQIYRRSLEHPQEYQILCALHNREKQIGNKENPYRRRLVD